MIYLLASIISSTAIYVIFRWAKNYNCKLNALITMNYLVATILGFGFLMHFDIQPFFENNHWLPYGVILGIMYILMFFLIGTSSQKAGITVTTLANKLSLVFPVFFSLFWFNEQITTLKYFGIAGAFAAVLLTLYKKDIKKTNRFYFVLPIAIFLGSGFIDSFIKYVQALQINDQLSAAYSSFVFFTAFIFGVLYTFAKSLNQKPTLHAPTLLLGALLGIANFGSLYFILQALNRSNLESSLVFALNNMLVVALSALLGFFIFKEKLNRLNIAGIVLAILSLYILL
ncbi:MAG: EamA family transporter [Bacteroidota bacterium]